MDRPSNATSEILAMVDRLPTLNTTAVRLMRMLNDEDVSFDAIEEVIRTDPALTTNLLRIANTAHFGLFRQVETVRHAVAVLGLKRLVDMVMLSAMSEVIPARLPGYDISARNFWRHCVAVAVLSEGLARQLVAGEAGLAFTCGLLHDLGKLVVAAYIGKHHSRSGPDMGNVPLSSALVERQTLGIDHGEVGMLVARAWGLPKVVVHVNQAHHNPKVFGHASEPENLVVMLVNAADAMAHALGYTCDRRGFHRRFAPGCLATLNLTGTLASRIADTSKPEIESLLAIFPERRWSVAAADERQVG